MTKRKTPRSHLHFRDCKYVMDLALQRPGLQHRFTDYGAATHFRMRCNQYRALLREMQMEVNGNIPGFVPETAYDLLIIRQVDEQGNADRKAGLIIQFDHSLKGGQIIDPATGEVFTLPEPGGLFDTPSEPLDELPPSLFSRDDK